MKDEEEGVFDDRCAKELSHRSGWKNICFVQEHFSSFYIGNVK